MSKKLGTDPYKFQKEKGQDSFSAVTFVRNYNARKFRLMPTSLEPRMS